jgi:hypothetical protein
MPAVVVKLAPTIRVELTRPVRVIPPQTRKLMASNGLVFPNNLHIIS